MPGQLAGTCRSILVRWSGGGTAQHLGVADIAIARRVGNLGTDRPGLDRPAPGGLAGMVATPGRSDAVSIAIVSHWRHLPRY